MIQSFNAKLSLNVIGQDAQRKVRTDDVVVVVASAADIQCVFLVEGMHRTLRVFGARRLVGDLEQFDCYVGSVENCWGCS